jgi:hypothetical protein
MSCVGAVIRSGVLVLVALMAQPTPRAAETIVVPDPPRPAGPPRIEPDDVLPGIDPSVPMLPEAARAALRAVGDRRPELLDALLRERIECYRRFFVNACLADVDARERRVESRLDRIRVVADQSLRDHEARSLNARIAVEEAARLERAEAEAVQRVANRQAREAREAAAEAEARARDREADALAREADANRAERARREAALAARREDARLRASRDAEHAARRQREFDAQRERQRVRELNEAEMAARRDRRRADAQRRAERERGLAENPAASRRPGSRPAPGTPNAPKAPSPPGTPGATPAPAVPALPTAPAGAPPTPR